MDKTIRKGVKKAAAPSFDETLKRLLNTPPDHRSRTKSGALKKVGEGKLRKRARRELG